MAIEAPSRRRAIEDVASALFHERGYPATSVRDIARALDIRGASLYAHVTSKEDVLWSIVDRAASTFEDAADRAAAGTASRSPADRLSALVRAHVEVIAADPELASVFVSEWRHLSADHRAAILARRDGYEARFRDVIVEGMATGDFGSTDPGLAATFILTALNGLATWYRPEGRLTAQRIADHYADLAVRTLTEDHR
jgi:TetR/AcrR family transcriptional regulator, cholesterol catabolism regulator